MLSTTPLTTLLLLLTATTTTLAAASTPRELFENYLPECALDCTFQLAEDVTGCGIDDTDCFCNAEGDDVSSLQSDLRSCLLASECEQSDYSEMSQGDLETYTNDALALCGSGGGDVPEDGAVTLSATKAIAAAGVMMLLAAF
ncbi:hypothetical protein BJX70DRAFT_355504 [Aspergillus crustosus]